MRQLYSVRKERLGIDVQPSEQRQPLVEHRAHHMACRCGAEKLQPQQAPHGMGGRDHPRARQGALADQAVEAHLGQGRQEQKQAAELGADGPRLQAQGPRTSARSATEGRMPGGRSSSFRRGSRANPSCLSTWSTATGLRTTPSFFRASLIS